MISIIIPVYNGEKFIEKTINSVLVQNIDKEIIVVDDCSTDNSYEIIKAISNKHKSVKIYKNDVNQGICRTLIVGLEHSCGDYVLGLGHDDLLPLDHCKKMLEKFDDETSLVFCDYDLIDENDNTYDVRNRNLHRDMTIKDFYRGNRIHPTGLVMSKKKLIEAGGFCYFEKFPNYVEYHLWIRMALCGKIVFCDSTRAQYRRHKTNITNTFKTKETKKDLNKWFNICKKQMLYSLKISLKDKIYILYYMIKRTIKINLRADSQKWC